MVVVAAAAAAAAAVDVLSVPLLLGFIRLVDLRSIQMLSLNDADGLAEDSTVVFPSCSE